MILQNGNVIFRVNLIVFLECWIHNEASDAYSEEHMIYYNTNNAFEVLKSRGD